MTVVLPLTIACSAGPVRGEANVGGQPPVEDEGADDGEVPRVDPRPTGPTVILARDGGPPVSVRVEIARAEPERTRGLMFRRDLAADAGMIFLFDRTERQSFWMENTLIPLDMIFIAEDMSVVGVVESAEPLTRTAREVDGDSRYVLEVNAGFAREHGIGPGTRVSFVGFEAGPHGEEATDAP